MFMEYFGSVVKVFVMVLIIQNAKRFGEVSVRNFRLHLHPNALKRIPILTGLNPCCRGVVSGNQRYILEPVATEGIRGAALTFLNVGLSPLK